MIRRIRMSVLVGAGMAAIVAGAPATGAVISVQNTTLPANATGEIAVMISGSEWIQGFSLGLMIADGGPDLGGVATHPPVPWFVAASSPLFEDLIVSPPTPWPGLPNFYVAIDIAPPAASPRIATGVLALVTVDTTGAASGEYPLTLIPQMTSLVGPSPVHVDGVSGILTIAPEPTMLVLFGLAGAAALRRRRA